MKIKISLRTECVNIKAIPLRQSLVVVVLVLVLTIHQYVGPLTIGFPIQ